MSADPIVQDIENLQAYNRYTYVQNNPLTLTDPSGFYAVDGLGVTGGYSASNFMMFNDGAKKVDLNERAQLGLGAQQTRTNTDQFSSELSNFNQALFGQNHIRNATDSTASETGIPEKSSNFTQMACSTCPPPLAIADKYAKDTKLGEITAKYIGQKAQDLKEDIEYKITILSLFMKLNQALISHALNSESKTGDEAKTKDGADQAVTENPVTIDDVIATAQPVRETSSGTKVLEKTGGQAALDADFATVTGQEVIAKTPKEGLSIKTLEDGRTVISRSFSSDGRATLEIQNAAGNKTHEIRYNK